MKRTLWGWAALLAAWAVMGAAQAENLSGRYAAEGGNPATLVLQEAADGSISGTLADPGMSLPVSARRRGGGFAGTIGNAVDRLPFTGTVQGRRIILDIGPAGESDRIAFSRSASAPAAAASAPPPPGPRPQPAAPAQRSVVINEQRLADAELAQIERAYKIRIGDAQYWYDATLGAWGVKGGPTLGFIAPGLKLGGALRRDASGGRTGVLVNGRELPPADVLALQQITGPILPGRYFITGQGLAGYEGGPPLWNLAAMAAQAGGGGSRTWQGRLSSGFSDGTTSAVFLPNGGIVSTGQ